MSGLAWTGREKKLALTQAKRIDAHHETKMGGAMALSRKTGRSVSVCIRRIEQVLFSKFGWHYAVDQYKASYGAHHTPHKYKVLR